MPKSWARKRDDDYTMPALGRSAGGKSNRRQWGHTHIEARCSVGRLALNCAGRPLSFLVLRREGGPQCQDNRQD
jgi:hypothetical protein